MCEHHHDPSDPSTTAHDGGARPGTVSRRRLLGAVALGATAFGLSRLPAQAAGVDDLNGPGEALESAERRPHPTTTTTTTTTLPPLPDLAPGEILFPVLVGPDDEPVWPGASYSAYVLENYGDCRSGCSRLHEGVDIMATEGLPVVSVSNGVITKQYTDTGKTWGAGNGWTIEDEENDTHYRYFHLRDLAPGLEEGDTVQMGQIIGSVGETGTTGNGTSVDNFHLHFEWRPGNIARDSYHVLHRPQFVAWQAG